MKKIKWENVITTILGGLYLHHTLNLEYSNIGWMITQVLFLMVGMGMFYHFVKALRKGIVLKEIKQLFID